MFAQMKNILHKYSGFTTEIFLKLNLYYAFNYAFQSDLLSSSKTTKIVCVFCLAKS